jgi:hypothetical protein
MRESARRAVRLGSTRGPLVDPAGDRQRIAVVKIVSLVADGEHRNSLVTTPQVREQRGRLLARAC